ncbi:MAG: methyltransferase domain-containing protein [Caldilineae bacterium]|nr:methyltransferase domain-containing protein [Anaerolineae bacterium]MCB0203842.1 methyltransferase domain-containing protein [Anaerolineae bacterium]MCB9154117.1 methyltransferase domain-containing protein [Caldilineae bacterium]
MNTQSDTKNVSQGTANTTGGAPPEVMDYEGSDYQERFWGSGERDYEDRAERIALRKLVPPAGRRLVEFGAAFGRLADLYGGYDQVILLDYSRSLLAQAQARLGHDQRFVFVAANLYKLPLVDGVVDTGVIVRVMHHLADVAAALAEIGRTVAPGGALVAEYASKRHLKSIARYALRRQQWSPFDSNPYEFVPLNFDFHPDWMTARFRSAGLTIEQELAVSHFRIAVLKQLVPARYLAAADGAVQGIGARWKLTPSVFVRCRVPGSAPSALPASLFQCPECRGSLTDGGVSMDCTHCGRRWPVRAGIFDFKEPLDV